ncbi:Por secretion system C-terminal sorting domain-containing protein [Chryseobacterium sp. RU37D]|uniref:T9SS type A sorting domain-containing protein n=1 Tax=Chryseobacterium sp. RU37D TaxID=1907397 RepID=UPI000953B101|nr:T9SS type A sorting domain-containing protein [Chryseobacterium sp. RU37D]SIQ20030.1 Por secretion system C-terminal sorting domain-containing protein [Chryseobacterium sp. RU37D]
MKKKIFSMIYVLAFGVGLKSQTCTSTANIPPNGTLNINGVNVTSSYTGSVSSYFNTWSSCSGAINFNIGSLWVGQNGVWTLTLNFDKPVNDLVFLIGATNIGESFSFNSNSGGVSITSINFCSVSITANTITGIADTNGGGGGVFKIHAPSGYTQLTINGPGGSIGSLLAACSASILGVDEINSSTKDNMVSIYPNPVQNNFTISSKDNLKSYEIFDESGRKVMSSSLKGYKQEVDISSLIKGNYIVSIETKQHKINKKFSKN